MEKLRKSNISSAPLLIFAALVGNCCTATVSIAAQQTIDTSSRQSKSWRHDIELLWRLAKKEQLNDTENARAEQLTGYLKITGGILALLTSAYFLKKVKRDSPEKSTLGNDFDPAQAHDTINQNPAASSTLATIQLTPAHFTHENQELLIAMFKNMANENPEAIKMVNPAIGESYLHYAIRNNLYKLAEVLVPFSDLGAQNKSGQNPLHLAISIAQKKMNHKAAQGGKRKIGAKLKQFITFLAQKTPTIIQEIQHQKRALHLVEL